MAISDEDVLFDKPDGALRTVEETGLAAGAEVGFDPGFDWLGFFSFLGRATSLRINNGSKRTGIKAGAALPTKEGVYIEANLNLAVNGVFRAFFGAGAAPSTVATDLVRHKMRNSG